LEKSCVGIVCEIHTIAGISANVYGNWPAVVAELVCEVCYRSDVSWNAAAGTKNRSKKIGRLMRNDFNWIEKIFGGTADESKCYRIG
jgi:hypothetical protein